MSNIYNIIKQNIIKINAIEDNYEKKIATSPPYDENNPIQPTLDAKYIENAKYFITPNEYPRYGNNTDGTCVTVAAQLLLSYNNYYNDRRIIDNIYLFGDEINNPEDNPNYCQNPEKITSETIGSTQDFHDMLLHDYNIVSYYADAKIGLENYLRDRNVTGKVNMYSNSSGSLDSNVVFTELDMGRPVIVGTKSQLAGVTDFNHAMVAYGYESFAAYSNSGDNTIYTGYIVNFGWDPYGRGNRVQVWTNQAWFNVAVSMEINHIHEYTTINNIEENSIRICKCYCGHREIVDTRRHIFSDFGYEGSTYSWKGLVEMRFKQGNRISSEDILIINDKSKLTIEVKTISHENAFLVTNGEIKFEIKNVNGEIIQTNICTVKVDLLNNVTLTGNTFNIDTGQLDMGTYYINMTSVFTRGGWSSKSVFPYTFIINRSIKIMSGFGYTSSWYKWEGNVKLLSDDLYLFYKAGEITFKGNVDLKFKIGTESVFNAVKEMRGTISFELKDNAGNTVPINGDNIHISNIRVGLISEVFISNNPLTINIKNLTNGRYTLLLNCTISRDNSTYNNSAFYNFNVENN